MRRRAALLAAAGLLLTGASFTAHREVAAGNAALDGGDPKGAAGHYEQALKARPDDPAVRYDLGTARLAAGDLDPAVDDLGTAAQGAQGALKGRAAYNLGNALMHRAEGKGPEGRSDLESAVQAYRQAVAADPGDADARRNLQLAATRLKDLETQPPPQPQPENGKPRDGDAGKSGSQQTGTGASNPGADGSPQAGGRQDRKNPPSASAGGTRGKEAEPGENGQAPSGTAGAKAGQEAPGTAPGRGAEDASAAAGTPSGKDGQAQGENVAQGGTPVPEDVARVLAALRAQEAATLREAMRRSMGKPKPEDKDW